MIDVSRDFERMRDYMVDRLSDEERRAFEERLTRDPALVREFEQSLQLREGLTELREQRYFARQAPRVRSWPSWVPTLAAAGIAGIALFMLLGRTGPSPVLMAALDSATGTSAASVTAHFTFVSMRGSSTPTLDLPSKGVIEFRAAPATRAAGSRYRVTLVHQDEHGTAKPVGEIAGLALGADGYVHLFADAARLSPGRYLLRVEAATEGSGAAEAFPFNLRVPGRQAPE